MPRYRVPYVVMQAPSLEHSMPGDDMTPIPFKKSMEVDAANVAEAKAIVKEMHPHNKVGKPELIHSKKSESEKGDSCCVECKQKNLPQNLDKKGVCAICRTAFF